MNSIDAKGYNFLQQNSPGNDGYGQIGLKGETGENGNSVYFTPYRLSSDDPENPADTSICLELIREGKELSNNSEYESKDITYKVNDLILDKLGNVYILNSAGELRKINNIFTQGSIAGTLTCTAHAIFSDPSDEYYYQKQNYNFLGEYNSKTGSPYIYHRDRYQNKLCGSWIHFSISIPENEQLFFNNIYKYVILLPNGQKVEKVSNNSSCTIFLDNRYFYSCRFSDTINTRLKTIANYLSIGENNEYEPEFTYELITNGLPLCKTYVEITNRDTHITYRIYADNIDLNIENITSEVTE